MYTSNMHLCVFVICLPCKKFKRVCPFAASPSFTHGGNSVNRYFIISSAVANIDIACAIQPGALPEKYSVHWTQVIDDGDPLLLNEVSFNISQHVSPQNPTTFMCKVTIEHMTNLSANYTGPEMTVHTSGKEVVIMHGTLVLQIHNYM